MTDDEVDGKVRMSLSQKPVQIKSGLLVFLRTFVLRSNWFNCEMFGGVSGLYLHNSDLIGESRDDTLRLG